MATLNVTPPVAAAPVVLPDSLVATNVWYPYLANLATALNAANAIINAIPGVNVFTVATQPVLGAGDAGYLGLVTDTNHLVRWTGAAWQWFGGDASGHFEDFAVAPPSPEFALCDGSATTLLTLGATLTLAAFTTPNLSGTPAFRRSGAAYTGTIDAAVAPGISGTSGATAPGTDTQGSHNHTGATGAHHHTTHTPATNDGAFHNTAAGVAQASSDYPHSHPDSTSDDATASISADGAHSHTVNSHTHGVGSIAVDATGLPAKLTVLPYVRR